MPHTFGDDERVAAEDDGDVVVPALEGAALEVVESELALELLVDSFGTPSPIASRHPSGTSRLRSNQ
jgi:hypothetical protein